MIDQRHGGPITIGFGRYEPDQSIDVTLTVADVVVILEGRLSVSTNAGTVTANPCEIVYMPKGESVTIRSHEQVALTASHILIGRRRSNEPSRHHHPCGALSRPVRTIRTAPRAEAVGDSHFADRSRLASI